MTDLANSIKPWIQFVGDVGSNYQDGRIPILDMKMCIIHVKVEADSTTGTPEFVYPQVLYMFFKKPMARQTIMAAKSAMPENIKRQTIDDQEACQHLQIPSRHQQQHHHSRQ